ncbi:hypothetical protein Tco_1038554 [Tanacetum coccineum]
MNPQETQQVAAHNEKWVLFSERVKISSTNVRLETIVPGTDNQEKDEKQSQNDKTGLGMEKTVKDKAKSTEKSTPGPESKKYKFRG